RLIIRMRTPCAQHKITSITSSMVKIPSISIIGAIKKSQDRMQPDMLKEGKKTKKKFLRCK
ncbi:hypothetical protein, partial [Thermoanaerobacterium butyriciformans]|uniref:hypothetical protein n=1 Tax=Thermoanaerobacterium butyriciformans TaxID=1702242 RepID=UPI001AE403A9